MGDFNVLLEVIRGAVEKEFGFVRREHIADMLEKMEEHSNGVVNTVKQMEQDVQKTQATGTSELEARYRSG